MITTRADGRPQASPVSCGVDDEGRIVIATYPERAKTRNARRDPDQVSVLFLSDDFGGAWVQVDGTAEVLDSPTRSSPWSTTSARSRASTRTGPSTARR